MIWLASKSLIASLRSSSACSLTTKSTPQPRTRKPRSERFSSKLRKSFIAVLLLSILPATAIDLDDYAAKLYPSLEPGLSALETVDYSANHAAVEEWLTDAETKLSKLPSLPVTFVFTLNQYGGVAALELDEINCSGDCVSASAYREFLSQLAALKLKPAPLEDLRFLLDAKYMSIARNETLESHRDAIASDLVLDSPIVNPVYSTLEKQIELCKEKSCSATLVGPDSLTNPQVGDEISFSLNALSQGYLTGRVIDTSSGILIATDKFELGQESYDQPLQYWQLEIKHGFNYDAVFSGLAAGGLGFGLMTNGLGPALLAGLSTIGANFERGQEITINRGDQFILKLLGYRVAELGQLQPPCKGEERLCKV